MNEAASHAQCGDGYGNAIKNLLRRWLSDVPYAWITSLLVFYVDGVESGRAFFCSALLLWIIVVRVPLMFLVLLFKRSIVGPAFRSTLVQLVCASTTMAYCLALDNAVPGKAMPVVTALEAFQTSKGSYPQTLNELVPDFLAALPLLKPLRSPPTLDYKLIQNGPELTIRDWLNLSVFCYDFKSKKWEQCD